MGSPLKHAAAPEGVAQQGQSSSLSVGMGAGPDASKSQNWRARRVQEWLLLLLRFAITRHPDDQEAALRTAGEIDSLGIKDGSSAPSFFRRSTTEVCGAIAASEHGSERHEILTKHLARIEDPRLRRAFRAGVDLDESSQQRTVRPDEGTYGGGL